MVNILIAIGLSILSLLSGSPLEASILSTTPMEVPYLKEEAPWSGTIPEARKGLFQQAVSNYKDGFYRESLGQFRALVEEGAGGKGSEAALFYIGSIYFKMALAMGKKDSQLLMNSLRSFQDGIRRYPESQNVPRALIEIGKIYLEMNMIEEARGSFNRVINGYPSTGYAAEAQFYIAKSYEREGRYRDALTEYKILTLRYPQEMEREKVFGTGGVYFYLHEFGEAKKLYDAGMKRWAGYIKGDPEILFNYSECLFQNGEFSRAREGFLNLYNIYPRYEKAAFALNRVGDTYMLERKWRMAEKMYSSVLELFPHGEDALISKLALGDVKISSEPDDSSYREALKYYREVEEASRDESLVTKARYKIGRLFESQGRYKDALNIYTELLHKGNVPGGLEISQAFDNLTGKIGKEIKDRIGRRDDLGAVKTYQTYFKDILKDLVDEELLMEVAEAHGRLRLYKESSEVYTSLIERKGAKREAAMFKIGESYFLSGNYTKAVEALDRYIAEYPDGKMRIDARVLVGEGLYSLKDFEKASNHFYAVIREAPYRYPAVYIKLSNILQKSGRYEDSIRIMKDMIRHLPEKSDRGLLSLANITLGNAYYGSGRYQEALDAYRSGLGSGDMEKGSETVRFMIGDCLLRLNRLEEAREIFSSLLEGSSELIKKSAEERLKDIASGVLWGET